MWTRELLKTNAKTVLARSYWRTFLVCLAASVLTGKANDEFTIHLDEEHLDGLLGFLARTAALVAMLAALAWTIFGANVLIVGWKRYMMENRLGDSPFDTLFSAFGGPHYTNVVKGMLWMNVKIFLYSLLFVVPGIIKSYEYYFVPYLLAENPQMSHERAMSLSTWMTEGEKMNIFVLELSFIGWHLLGALAFGIGNFFVIPYEEATKAELYAAMRAKAFHLGLTDEVELGGFIRY